MSLEPGGEPRARLALFCLLTVAVRRSEGSSHLLSVNPLCQRREWHNPCVQPVVRYHLASKKAPD